MESESTFVRRFGVDGREGSASFILNLTKKTMRYEFDTEPRLELLHTLSGRSTCFFRGQFEGIDTLSPSEALASHSSRGLGWGESIAGVAPQRCPVRLDAWANTIQRNKSET